MGTTSIESLTTSVNSVNENIKKMGSKIEEMMELISHIHDAHLHSKPHKCDELEGISGGPYFVLPPDETSILMSEYNNLIDKDENGMVYGIDFIIDDTDESCPNVLREHQAHMSEDDKNGLTILSWDDYLQSCPWNK